MTSPTAGLPSGHLPQDELDEFFVERIQPDLTGTPREHPTAVFIAGQPGVGKTTTQGQVVARLGPEDVVSLDGDDNVLAHPHYDDLALADDRTAMIKVDDDASYWSRRSREHVREQRLDVVISYPLGNEQWAADLIRDFTNDGYRTEIIFIAGHESVSQLGIIDRYQHMRDAADHGRWVTPESHQQTVEGCIRTAEHLEREHLVDEISIRTRNGVELYHNSHDSTGNWIHPPQAAQALRDGQQRAWTPAEIEDFRQKSAALADPERQPKVLAADLQPLLRDTVTRGEAHIAAQDRTELRAKLREAAERSPIDPTTVRRTTTSHQQRDPEQSRDLQQDQQRQAQQRRQVDQQRELDQQRQTEQRRQPRPQPGTSM